jgi:hypothetical protein
VKKGLKVTDGFFYSSEPLSPLDDYLTLNPCMRFMIHACEDCVQKYFKDGLCPLCREEKDLSVEEQAWRKTISNDSTSIVE